MRQGLVPVFALTLLVAGSALAAVEVPVSPDLTFQTAPMMKRLPALAAGDGGYLAVWLDTRNGDYTLTATRVAATGEPLDPLGIPLGRAAFRQPQVLWNGESYLVFWNASEETARLMVTRVSREGVAEAPRVLLEGARLDVRARVAATNGTHIVLAYTEGYGDRPMHVAVMTLDAVLIEDRVVDARSSWMPTVVVNDREFLVAWNVKGSGERYDFVALRLDSRGAAIDASPRKIGAGFGTDILRNGSDYVAVSPASGDWEPEYRLWSVSRNLAHIGAAAPLSLTHYDREPSLLDGAPARMVIFDVTSEKTFVSAVTFDGNGHEAGPRKRMMESIPSHFAVAHGGDALALIEVEPDGVDADLLVGSVFDDATLSRKAPDRSLALSAREQRDPVIAGGGNRYLVVWGGPDGVKAGRFLPNGARLDANGLVLDPYASLPAAVFDGERFVVAYFGQRGNASGLVVRFVSPRDGLLPEEQFIDTNRSYSPSSPGLAAGDGVVLLTWTEADGVHAAALRGTQWIAPPRKIADSLASTPAASWSGGRFLVVWDESEYDYDVRQSARLRSMRFESDLTPVDAQPRSLFEGRGGPKDAVLTAWKRGWLVAFQDGYDVRLHEVAENGELEETPLATVAGSSPKLVNTRSRPWLAWTSRGADLLRAAPLRPDGTLETEDAHSIAAPPFGYSFGYFSSLGALGDGIAAAYARIALEAGTVRRVFVSVMENRSPGRRRSVR